MIQIIKRGLGLLKVGRAIREIRKSSDEDTHERAQQYLMELLGQSRGLPTKVGQFLSMDNGNEQLRDTLAESTPPMAYEEVLAEIEKAYGKPWNSLFKSLEREGKNASLGQVHFGKLRDGRSVAVKVQYPEIAGSVEAEMKLFGWMPKVGPVSKWGFSLEGYRETFHENFMKELDYLHEADQQVRYRELCRPLDEVVIPEVLRDMCRPNVLVQIREDGLSLDEAEKLPLPQRKALGRAVVKHFFHMLFRHGLVHSDPNPGNFAFRADDPESMVVYDYGSVLEVPESVRLGILRTILALETRESVDPLACLAALGFDTKKLEDLRPTLPALLQVLFDPFTTQAPYHAKDWRISERFDGIVGDLKWWFRSAAPPDLIFLMRTLHGMTNLLMRLDVEVSWRFMLDKVCGDMFRRAANFELPRVTSDGKASGFDAMARYLKVYVLKGESGRVELTMPSRVAEELEDVIDAPVLETIRKQNIDLKEIQKRAQQSGFVPQPLFEVKDEIRYVRVWLE